MKSRAKEILGFLSKVFAITFIGTFVIRVSMYDFDLGSLAISALAGILIIVLIFVFQVITVLFPKLYDYIHYPDQKPKEGG